MPFRTVTKFFRSWFDRKQGGLGPERAVINTLPTQELRDKFYDSMLRVSWRAYQKGRNEGRRGYTEITVRRRVGNRNRKKSRKQELIIREGE